MDEVRVALGLDERPRSSRVLLAAAAAAAIAIAAAVGAVLVVRDDPAAASPGGSLARIDGSTGDVLSTTPTASRRHTSPSRAGRSGSRRRTRSGLDPAVGAPVKIEAVGYVHDLVGLGGKMYVSRDGEKLLEGFVVPYDARNGTPADGVSILACSMTASPALGLWVAGCPNVLQLRIEPNRLRKGRLVKLRTSSRRRPRTSVSASAR